MGKFKTKLFFENRSPSNKVILVTMESDTGLYGLYTSAKMCFFLIDSSPLNTEKILGKTHQV